MKFNDEHIPVLRCAQFGITSAYSDAVNLAQQRTFSVASAEEDMSVRLQLIVFEALMQNVPALWVTGILCILLVERTGDIKKLALPLI